MANDVIEDFSKVWAVPVLEETRNMVLAAGYDYDFSVENDIEIDLSKTPDPQTVTPVTPVTPVTADLSKKPDPQTVSKTSDAPNFSMMPAENPAVTPALPEVTEESLNKDPIFIEASRRMAEMNQDPRARLMTDSEAAEYGKEFMGWFNYHLPTMVKNSYKLDSATHGQKLSMLYLMEQYDKKNISWEGTQRFFNGIVQDPTTYFGLGTFGIGVYLGATVKQLTKIGFRSALKASLPGAILGAIEGGFYGGVDEFFKEEVRVLGGRQEEKSVAKIAATTVGGVVIGSAFAPAGALTLQAVKNIATAVKQSFPKVLGSGKININAPEIIAGRKAANDIPETYKIKSIQRNQLRGDLVNKLIENSPAEQGRQLYIIVGPPASGKSSVAGPVAEANKARIIDSDLAKEELPEFQNGLGAPALHEESDSIMKSVLLRSATNGDNMVIPLVGKGTKKVETMIAEAKKWGYETHLILVDLPIKEAASRAANRFMTKGRWVDPNYVLSIKKKPSKTYEALKDKVKSYAKYSNDVLRGEEPKIIEQGEN